MDRGKEGRIWSTSRRRAKRTWEACDNARDGKATYVCQTGEESTTEARRWKVRPRESKYLRLHVAPPTLVAGIDGCVCLSCLCAAPDQGGVSKGHHRESCAVRPNHPSYGIRTPPDPRAAEFMKHQYLRTMNALVVLRASSDSSSPCLS